MQNNFSYNRTHTTQSGFSLIEVLVSLSIFAIVMTIAVGSLMTLIGLNARVQNSQALMTNLSYALDSMTREIRTGTDYYCATPNALPRDGAVTRDCSGGETGLSFNEGGMSITEFASSRRILYRLNGTTIERRLGNGAWLPVTAPSISIDELRFYVTGSARGDAESPTVTVFVSGTTGEANDDSLSQFNIQTSVVQQLLDI
jgi:prepilin-type N-terminal cleavage/methylation domain-containing protein